MNSSLQDKSRIISEALPFINRYRGKRVLVKIGGAAMSDQDLLESFAKDVSLLSMLGIEIVVVHGGGPQIGIELEKEGIPVRKAKGLRITDEATLAVTEKVLFGQLNKSIVEAIRTSGAKVQGLNGKDGHLVQATLKKDPEVDYGLVGTVIAINTGSVNALGSDVVPVIAPLGCDRSGQVLNVNADEAASALAIALGCEALLLLTDTDGVHGEDGQTIAELTVEATNELVEKGIIKDGMLPKVSCALEAIAGGVTSGRIINGSIDHALLLEMLTDQGTGTMIHAKFTD